MLAFVVHAAWLFMVILAMAAVYQQYGSRQRDFSEVVGSLYAPFILLVVYGIVPLQVHVLPQSELIVDREYYVLSFLLMSVGGIAYMAGFEIHRLIGVTHRRIKVVDKTGHFQLKTIFLAVAALDLYTRVVSMFEGTYFSWMAASIRQSEQFDPTILQMLMQGTGPLLGVLLVSLSRRAVGYKVYFFVIFLLVLMEGNRGALTYFVIATGLAWMHQRQAKSIPVFRVAAAIAVLFIGYKLVLDMRILWLVNRAEAASNPVLFLADATRIGLLNIVGVGQEIPTIERTGVSFSERTLAWGHALSFQVSKLYTGADTIGITGAMREIASVIPDAFWVFSDKPDLVTGRLLAAHFDSYGLTSDDPATTSFSSAYLFGGAFGLIIFGFLFGVLQRVLRDGCKRWLGETGKVVYIGSIAFITVRANSFAGAFVGARNFLVILFAVLGLIVIARSVMLIAKRSKYVRT